MNLNQVTLPSLDVARAARYYRELGFVQIVDSAPRYARFECPEGGATFSLHLVEAMPAGPGVVVYFECPDLDRQYDALLERGVRFESPPADQPWLWREAYLRDPDGNLLCLYWAGELRRNPPWRIGAATGDAPA